MRKSRHIYCVDLRPEKCCSSCHDEWDEGYGEPSQDEIEGTRYLWRYCCRGDEPLPTRREIVQFLWDARRLK